MDSTPADRRGPAVGDPVVVPVTDELKRDVAAVTGHTGTVLGAVERRTNADREPDKLVVDFYTDDDGHTHIVLSEMWPPGYHVGMVVVDAVLD